MIAALRASLERLPFTELADALEAVEEAHGLIEQASAGSGQTELHHVLVWFSHVVDGIDQLQRELSAIHASVTEIANRLEGTGRTSEPVSSASPAPPRHVALLSKLPARTEGKTSGIWVDESGAEHPIVSENMIGSRHARCWQNWGSAQLVARCG